MKQATRVKRGFTLKRETVRKLLFLKAETGKPYGDIIDGLVQEEFKSPEMKKYASHSTTLSS